MSRIQIDNPAWQAIMDDPKLERARQKLSFHEIRLIVRHAQENAPTPSSPLPDNPTNQGNDQ